MFGGFQPVDKKCKYLNYPIYMVVERWYIFISVKNGTLQDIMRFGGRDEKTSRAGLSAE